MNEKILFYRGNPDRWTAIVLLVILSAICTGIYFIPGDGDAATAKIVMGILPALVGLLCLKKLLSRGGLELYAVESRLYWRKGKKTDSLDVRRLRQIKATVHESNLRTKRSHSPWSFVEIDLVDREDKNRSLPLTLSSMIYAYKPDAFRNMKDYCLRINPDIAFTETKEQ